MNDLIGKIVVIKRNGADGPQFPLRTNECLFGRKPECDIRIQLPNVSLEHAVVKVDKDKKIKLINLSSCNQTLVNGKPISQAEVQHLDVFTISDRSFRFEFPSPVQKQAKEKSPKTRHRRSSSTGNTPQENKTPRMPLPKGSPRTPPTGGSLKENIYRLRRHSMPLQEEEEALASPGADKKPFSMIALNCEPQEKNGESAELVKEKRKSTAGERKTKRSSKRVSFGPVLSPEQFDKELPPATPVRRGATPRRASNASDHSFQLCSSSKKRRSVIASPKTESITEEDDSQDSSENETPKTQAQFSSKLESSEQGQVTHEVNIHELTSQQCCTPKGRGQSFPQFDAMILECTEKEDVIPKSPTPEKCTASSERVEREITESEVMEAVLKDTPKVCKQFPSNQATPKSATPKHSRRSSSRLAGKNCVSAKKERVSTDYATPKECGQSSSSLEEENVGDAGPNQALPETDTPQSSRRSSMRLAGNSSSLLEVRSVDEVQSKVTPHSKTASLSHTVEENMDETILDSDDYTSDEEDADREMAIGKDKPTRLATPLRKEIEGGVELQKTKKTMVTPLKREIANGIRLRQTKSKMVTPLKKDIEEGVKLQETKKRMATPLKKEISEGIRLRETKKRLATPLQKEIIDGTNLRQTKRKMATPLRNDIKEGIKLQETKKRMATPLKKEISEGIRLRETKKRLATPLQKEIIDGTNLRQTKRKMATPLRNDIKEGIKLQETKKRMATPLKKEISGGIRLRETKKRLATPLQKEIIDGTDLRQTKRKMATPLRNEINEGIKLQETKKKMATPLQKEISEGIRLRETKKRMATPLKREIIDGTSLRQTKKKMATPLKKEITEGITLRGIKKKLRTPIRKAIEDGVTLRVTKKKLSTELQKAIQAKPKLRKTKKTMNSLLQNEIKQCPKLRTTKQTMPLEVQIEIIKGTQLRPTKKSLPTPLKHEIKRGVQLQKAKKSLPTPLRRQLEGGVSLKQTGKSLKRKRSESSTKDDEPKRLKPSPSIGVNETDRELDVVPIRRALKTPIRQAIAAGTRLRTTRHRMATPLRKQIHSKHTLRTIRRKSTVITVPKKTVARKPTYAEIVKRPKKTVAAARRVSRGSCKSRNMTKGSSKVIPSAKITDTAVKHPEIARVQVNDVQLKDRRNSTSLARQSTPQTKSAKLTPSSPVSNDKAKRNSWMSSLARATNGVKTRAMPVENLEGLSEMFTTPPAIQMTSNNFPGKKHSGNWLSSLAKATNGSRKRGVPVEDLQGVPEMFSTPPSANARSDCNRRSSIKSLPSTDEEAMLEIMNVAPLETLQVRADAVSPDIPMLHVTESLEPTKTPSLRSSGKDTTQIEIVSPIKSSCTPSLRSGRMQTAKSAVTPPAMIEIGEVLKPSKTPSLRNSAEDTVIVQVVTPVQPSRTPSLRSARTQSCIQNSECSGLELEIVQPIAPSRTPSMRSSAETKAVLRKSIGNPTEDPKSLGLQGLTRLMRSPKESSSAESVENFFVPNMFASPKPQPKRYSRKSEGLQGVARLLRTPVAENDLTAESPKLDGIKSMMQPEKSPASPYFVGLKTLMKTPKTCDWHVDPEEYFSAELFTSPVQDSSQDTSQSVSRGRKDKKRSVAVIEPTSSMAEVTTAERSGNIVSETLPRTTRSKRKAPEESLEPVPKRVRRTRATVRQQDEVKTETPSNSKAVQKKTAVKSQKKKTAAIQDTPKPFVFKRTKLDPIIEVQSPLASFDDAIEITTTSSLYEVAEKASNEDRKAGNVPKTRKQSSAPLRSSRRGNRCIAPAETPVEEFTSEKVPSSKKTESVTEDSTSTGDSQKAPVKTPEPKGERKRATRNTKANKNSLNTMASPIKTRMTRNQRAEIADLEEEVVNCGFIEEAVNNPAPRRARRVTKTTQESAQVLGKTKPTRSTDREETHDEAADLVPEIRSTRASRKQAHDSKVVENDNLARSTRGKNKGKEEVKELKKEATTNEIRQPRGARSARRTRGNSAQKADFEGDDASLEEKKEVRPDNSSKKPRAKRELKRSTTDESRETRSTRSRKPPEDKNEFTEQSMHSKVGIKRSRQESAETPPPEPKRTRASARAQGGSNTRITRSHSHK